MTRLFDVHTLREPVRHFQQYEDPALAQRMAQHLSKVIGEPLVAEPVEVDEPEVAR